MTQEHATKYSSKHPAGTRCEPSIAKAIEEETSDREITCAVAHDLADFFQVAPSEIGRTADLMEYRIVKCQLGLFGFPPKKKIVRPADNISPDLQESLDRSVVDGQISCISIWEIAHGLHIPKMMVAGACERLGLKIKPCQLGAF